MAAWERNFDDCFVEKLKRGNAQGREKATAMLAARKSEDAAIDFFNRFGRYCSS